MYLMKGDGVNIKEDKVVRVWNQTLTNGTGLALAWNGTRRLSTINTCTLECNQDMIHYPRLTVNSKEV